MIYICYLVSSFCRWYWFFLCSSIHGMPIGLFHFKNQLLFGSNLLTARGFYANNTMFVPRNPCAKLAPIWVFSNGIFLVVMFKKWSLQHYNCDWILCRILQNISGQFFPGEKECYVLFLDVIQHFDIHIWTCRQDNFRMQLGTSLFPTHLQLWITKNTGQLRSQSFHL